jgi:hypothetical protein
MVEVVVEGCGASAACVGPRQERARVVAALLDWAKPAEDLPTVLFRPDVNNYPIDRLLLFTRHSMARMVLHTDALTTFPSRFKQAILPTGKQRIN